MAPSSTRTVSSARPGAGSPTRTDRVRITTGPTDSGTPIAGRTVTLKLGGTTVATAVTDADGFYGIAYKHTGKAADYTLETAGKAPVTITLKSNGIAVVNFEF